MRSLKAVLLALPAVALLAASPLPAQGQNRPGSRPGGGRPQPPLFEALDRNGDGVVSAKELERAVDALKSIDRNRDRRISMDEMRPRFVPPDNQPASRQRSGGPGSRGSSSLERAGLRVGSMLPEVNIFNAEGQVVSTASLRGSYTVLVFGCLT